MQLLLATIFYAVAQYLPLLLVHIDVQLNIHDTHSVYINRHATSYTSNLSNSLTRLSKSRVNDWIYIYKTSKFFQLTNLYNYVNLEKFFNLILIARVANSVHLPHVTTAGKHIRKKNSGQVNILPRQPLACPDQHSNTLSVYPKAKEDRLSKTIIALKLCQALRNIKTPGIWNNEAGDLVPALIIKTPIWPKKYHLKIVTDNKEITFGDNENTSPLTIRLHGMHYNAQIDGKNVNVPGDGDCFYHAIIKVLQAAGVMHSDQINVHTLRLWTAQVLEDHIDKYHEFLTNLIK